MSKKFLTKEGLIWFFEKMKERFAPIDSPHFTGKPTVETPKYEEKSDGKEVINREYLSKVQNIMTNELEQKLIPVVFKFSISLNDWEKGRDFYYYDRVKNSISNNSTEELNGIFCSIKLDYLKCDSSIYRPNQSFNLDMDENLRIYLLGNKPNIDIPVIVTITRAIDLSYILGGI